MNTIYAVAIVLAVLFVAYLKFGSATKLGAWIKTWWMKRKVSKALSKILSEHERIAPTYSVPASSIPQRAVNQGAEMTNAEIFNENGIRLTQMDHYLGQATALNVNPHNTALQAQISAAHALVSESGLALAELYKAVMTPADPPKPGPILVLAESYFPKAALLRLLTGSSYPFEVQIDSVVVHPGKQPAVRYTEGYMGAITRAKEDGPVVVPVTPQPDQPSNQIDPRTLTEDDWQYYVRHPEVWGKVRAELYTNQQINAHQQGGDKYNPSWVESNYLGVLR